MTRSRFRSRSRIAQLKVWFPRIVACLGAVGVCAASCLMATGSVAGLGGCVDDDAGIALDDVTGIVIRSEALFASVGCGTGPTQVYRYVSIADQVTDSGTLADDGGAPILGSGSVSPGFSVTPCYADATFDLPSSTLFYHLRVYAFSYAAYQALGGTDAPLQNTLSQDGALRALSPTYLTTCATKSQVNVEVLAVCSPLTLLDGGLFGGTGDDDASDTVDAGDAGDAGDASDDGGDGGDAADAGDGSPGDADAGDASGNDAH